MNVVYAARYLGRLNDRVVLLVLAAMTTLALLVALWTTRQINPLRGDTFEYLYFDPSRTVGYPVFLWFVRLITGHVGLAVPAQMAMLAGSFLALGWSFHKLVGRTALSFIFLTTLLCQLAVWKAAAFLMTEALSTALVTLWCAQLLRMIKAPSSRRATLLVVLSGLATMVRPPFISLFFGTAVFLLATLPQKECGRALLNTAAGLALAWAATPITLYWVHGSMETTTPFARGVLQHTLFCRPETVPADADSTFVEQHAAAVRQYIERTPPDTQPWLARAYTTPLRFGLIIPVLGRRHHLEARSQVDQYLSRIARDRVKANPYCYAASVFASYYRLATYDVMRTKEGLVRIKKAIAAYPPVELPQYPVLSRDEWMARHAASEVGGEVSGLNPERQQLRFVGKMSALWLLPIRLLYGLAALLGAVAFMALATRRRFTLDHWEMFAGAAAMGVAFHANLAITALVEFALARYVVPLSPLVCTLVACAIAIFADRRYETRQFLIFQPLLRTA